MVKVSLVTTVFNRDKYISAAIESVLSQQHRDFEYIIWDDGSTDNSLEIANFYAQQDSRIKVISANHEGRGIALSKACQHLTGKYFGLVDSDDLLSVDCLAETVNFLNLNTHVDLVYTNYVVVDADSQFKGYGTNSDVVYSPEKLLTEFMVFHFRLMKTSIFEKVGGFDPTFNYCQDYDLCLKISEVGEIQHLKKPLYYYRQHSGSISFDKRLEQLLFSKRAIEDALKRRNMDAAFELEFQIFARCTLYRKSVDRGQ